METGYIKIVQQEGKAPLVEARLTNGNLWHCKYDIAKLFNCFPAKIEMNLRSIFKNHLLREEEVSYVYRYTDRGIEKRQVYYNFEVLIFLSYRIGTFEAEVFRKFVRTALQEHLQKKVFPDSTILLWYFCHTQNHLWN